MPDPRLGLIANSLSRRPRNVCKNLGTRPPGVGRLRRSLLSLDPLGSPCVPYHRSNSAKTAALPSVSSSQQITTETMETLDCVVVGAGTLTSPPVHSSQDALGTSPADFALIRQDGTAWARRSSITAHALATRSPSSSLPPRWEAPLPTIASTRA